MHNMHSHYGRGLTKSTSSHGAASSPSTLDSDGQCLNCMLYGRNTACISAQYLFKLTSKFVRV